MDPPRTPPALSQVHLAEVGTCDACLRSGRQRLNVGLALGVALPGAYLGVAMFAGLPHPELTPPLEALVFGLAVVGAAFVLSWAAELAALEISAGLAISILALVAVLPEYAVDFVFAWRGGNDQRFTWRPMTRTRARGLHAGRRRGCWDPIQVRSAEEVRAHPRELGKHPRPIRTP
jgi:hypothetical protein